MDSPFLPLLENKCMFSLGHKIFDWNEANDTIFWNRYVDGVSIRFNSITYKYKIYLRRRCR